MGGCISQQILARKAFLKSGEKVLGHPSASPGTVGARHPWLLFYIYLHLTTSRQSMATISVFISGMKNPFQLLE